MEKTNLLGLYLSKGTYNDFLNGIMESALAEQSSYTCVANVHMLIETRRDQSFARIVNHAQIVTPDGQPLTWALKLLKGLHQERVAGMDLLPDLLERAQQQNLPVYFYGGDCAMLKATESYLLRHYPQIKIAGLHSPPFRELTAGEELDVIERINGSGARLVFVILGCPKQEKWMASMQNRVRAAMIGVGGSLPVMIGLQKRAPVWMQRSGLEWLFRLSQEPGRLFKRYAVTNTRFICLLLTACVRRPFSKKHQLTTSGK